MRILRDLKDIVDPRHTALLIIDAQVDFCSPEGLLARKLGVDVSRIEACIPRLNHFVEECRKRGVQIFWIRQELRKDRMYPNQMTRLLDEEDQVWYDMPDSPGADWHPALIRPLDTETVITKNSYCAFRDTELHLCLQSAGIQTVLVTGFTTGVCVETTSRNAFLNGYHVVLVPDCADAHTEEEHLGAITAIKTFFGWCLTQDELYQLWDQNN